MSKRAEALKRQEAREARTDMEQLDRLVIAGHGDCGEAAELRLRIEQAAAEEVARVGRERFEEIRVARARLRREAAKRELPTRGTKRGGLT